LILCSLEFAVCESRKSLIYLRLPFVVKAPKAGVAGCLEAESRAPVFLETVLATRLLKNR